MEWRASHILVKEKGLADDLRNRFKSGGNFGELAAEFSTCPSKSKSGDLGWFGPSKMVKAFEDAVKRMSHGSISNVVSTQFGYHIIKKTGQKD
ncbi:MAG: peptidylprolyl isomerase [Nitrospirota bacterium]|nr:peptidylprolyl isomerase [Nitrospirota bacterium]